MQYFDKNGKEIKAGMKILMEDGSIEMVYDTEDQYGNPNLGINASTHYNVTCNTLELFEIGTTWKGTARVHGAGEHVRTVKVDYCTTVTMPEEDTHDYTRRGLLRKDLREWCGRTFANKSTVTKETIVLNDGEDCLTCEGFIKKVGDKWLLTNSSHDAEYYGAYKLYLTKDGKDVGHEDLEYLFMADTLGYVSSVSVKKGFF